MSDDDGITEGVCRDIPQQQRDMRKNLLARQTGVGETTALAVDLRRQADVIIAPGLFEQQDALTYGM